MRSFVFALLFLLFVFNLEAVYILRFSTTDNGGISFTGNTLGLGKEIDQNEPGTADAIGAFITTDTSKQVGNYPPGTTLNWQENSSTAVLDLPSGAVVLYAELVWSGTFGYQNEITGNEPDTPITLITPQNTPYTITPDPATAQISVLFPGPTPAGDYCRSRNITFIVQAAGSGTYTVGGVAATVHPLDNTHNSAGWTLAVVYQHGNMITSNLTFFVGCERAINGVIRELEGFCTPKIGELSGRLFVSAIEADANKSGDSMLFGPHSPPYFPADALSGTGNPQNNFFASQINSLLPLTFNPTTGKLEAVGSGQLDTRGSFGTINQDVSSGTNIPGARQGYDITSVDATSHLMHDQSMAYSEGTTSGDDYTINALALQIATSSPLLVTEKLVNGQNSIVAQVGETVTFTVSYTNNGDNDALDLLFSDILPKELSYVPNSTKIDGTPVIPDPDLLAGFTIGDLAISETVVVEFQAQIITAPPEGAVYTNIANLEYSFRICDTTETATLQATSNIVIISIPPCEPPSEPPVEVNWEPLNFSGIAKTAYLLNDDRYQVNMTWEPPTSGTPLYYLIYSKGEVIGKIDGSAPLLFEFCFRTKKEVNTLQITAVFPTMESKRVNVEVSYE